MIYCVQLHAKVQCSYWPGYDNTVYKYYCTAVGNALRDTFSLISHLLFLFLISRSSSVVCTVLYC